MTTTMSWMIAVLGVMVAYAIASVIGWNVLKKNQNKDNNKKGEK